MSEHLPQPQYDPEKVPLIDPLVLVSTVAGGVGGLVIGTLSVEEAPEAVVGQPQWVTEADHADWEFNAFTHVGGLTVVGFLIGIGASKIYRQIRPRRND